MDNDVKKGSSDIDSPTKI